MALDPGMSRKAGTKQQQLSKGTIFRAVAAGFLVVGSKAAAVLKSSGSALKIGSLVLGGAGAAAAYNGKPIEDSSTKS